MLRIVPPPKHMASYEVPLPILTRIDNRHTEAYSFNVNLDENSIACPHCGQTSRQVKAGLNEGHQRYKCLDCRRRYTAAPDRRGYPEDIRQRALGLYAEGLSLRQIGKQLNVNHATVLSWVRASLPVTPEPESKESPAGQAQMKRRASIADVAERAGVSNSTVSNYLNDKGRMGRQARERIEAAMRDLHFAPNALVRAIRHGRTGIIGVLTFGMNWLVDPRIGSMTGSLLQGISDTAASAEKEILLYAGWPFGPKRYSEQDFLNGHIDGLIWMVPEINHPLMIRIADAGLPVVALLTRHVPKTVSYVNADNVGGVQAMIRYLLDLGHRRIAYVGPAHSSNYIDRRDAYRQALASASIPRDPTLEASPQVDIWNMDYYLRCIDGWLAMRKRPTAIVAADDGFAEKVVNQLVARGIRVPEDISVTGFNDLPMASQFHGGLSTIHQSFIEIGRLGAERMIELIDSGVREPFATTVPTQIVIRQTTGPAPKEP